MRTHTPTCAPYCLQARQIAKYDTANGVWSSLTDTSSNHPGIGPSGTAIYSLLWNAATSKLYAAGSITSLGSAGLTAAGGVVEWTGSNWQVATTPNSNAHAVSVRNGGGNVRKLAIVTINGVARLVVVGDFSEALDAGTSAYDAVNGLAIFT
jgi:hypothetical protein